MDTDYRGIIMLIDDSSTNNYLYRNILKDEGYSVVTFSGARKALDKLGTIIPSLIIVDLLMPDIDGFGFLDAKNKIPKVTEIPVIFLTSLKSIDHEKMAYQMGAKEYLVKPLGIKEFIQKVNRIIEKKAL